MESILEPPGRISIHHPGYVEDYSLMLVFRGRDSKHGEIDFDFVFTSCAIVADNHFDGWLSHSRDIQGTRLQRTRLLPPGKYYFHVPGSAYDSICSHRYPIVPTFRHWRYPRVNDLPRAWATLSASSDPESIQRRCAVTNHTMSLDRAHVVPSAENEWFVTNDMDEFGTAWGTAAGNTMASIFNDQANLLWLRADIHRAWDNKILTFVPKQSREDESQYNVLVHFLDQDSEAAYLYHGLKLQACTQNVSRPFLLSRLAWTILPAFLKGFLSKNVSRNLCVETEDGIVEKVVSGADCRAFASFPSRSQSPRKRKQEPTEVNEVENRLCLKRARNTSSFDSGFESMSSSEEEKDTFLDDARGRPRQRNTDY